MYYLQLTNQQVIDLSVNASGCSVSRDSSLMMYVVCQGGRQFRSNSEHRWFVAITNCGSPSGITIDYALLVHGMTGSCPTGSGNTTEDRWMALALSFGSRLATSDAAISIPGLVQSITLTMNFCTILIRASMHFAYSQTNKPNLYNRL